MTATEEQRTEMVTIRLTPTEHRRAQRVAEYHGINVAALFRMLVRKEAREIGESEDTYTPPTVAATRKRRTK